MNPLLDRHVMDKRSEIILTPLDLHRLETHLDALPEETFPGKKASRAELDRAEVIERQYEFDDALNVLARCSLSEETGRRVMA